MVGVYLGFYFTWGSSNIVLFFGMNFFRDGLFGACFFKKSNTDTPMIFAARPGSRMWEVECLFFTIFL